MAKVYLMVGAVYGFLAVALGAFGAHALRGRLDERLYQAFQTGIHYHALHALALLAVGLLALHRPSSLLGWSGGLFAVGVLLFSGSLYLLAITGLRTLGMVTPFGGLCLMAGWLCLALAAARLPTH